MSSGFQPNGFQPNAHQGSGGAAPSGTIFAGSGSATAVTAVAAVGSTANETVWTGAGSATGATSSSGNAGTLFSASGTSSSSSSTSGVGERRHVRRLWLSGPVEKSAPVVVSYDAAWTGNPASNPRLLASARSDAGTYTQITHPSQSGSPDVNYSIQQFVSEPLRASVLEGTIRHMVMVCDGTLGEINKVPCCLRVVSNDGSTVKATLLAVGDQAYNFGSATTGSTTYGRVSLNYASLTPYTCEDGDRLVFEVGANFYYPASNVSVGSARISGGISGSDIAWANGGYFNVNGWLELFVSEISFIKDGSASESAASATSAVGKTANEMVWTGSASETAASGTSASGDAYHTTRVYLAADSSVPPISPAYDADWDNTTGVVRRMLVRNTFNDSYEGLIASFTSGQYRLSRQYVSDPLPAMSIAGRVRGAMRFRESNLDDNITWMLVSIRVVSNDGSTVLATLLETDSQVHVFNEIASNNYTRIIRKDASLTPYTCSEGDRLVIEIGATDNAGNTPAFYPTWFADLIEADSPFRDDTAAQTRVLNTWMEFHLENALGFILVGTASETAATSTSGVGEIGPDNFGWASAVTSESAVGDLLAGTTWTGSGSSTSSTESTALGGTVFSASSSSTSDTDETASAYLLAAGSASSSSSTSVSAAGGQVFSASGSSTSTSSATGNGGTIYTGSSSQSSITDSFGSGYLEAVGSSSVLSTTSSSGAGVLKAAGSGSVSSTSASSGVGYLICRGSSSVSAVTSSPGIGHTFILASGVSTSSSQSSGLGGTVFSASGSSTSASATSAAGGQVFTASGSSTSDTDSTASGGTVFAGSSTTSSSSASAGNGSALFAGSSSSSSSSVSSGAGYLRAAGFGSSVSQSESTGSGGANWANNLGLAASVALAVGVGSLINGGTGFASSETFSEGRGRIKQYSVISVSTETEKQPDKQTFLKRRDRCIISSFQQDFYKRVVTPVRLFKANKDPDFDSLYLERENDFDTPGEWVEVKAYVRFDPQHIETKKEGIEQYRPVIIDFSIGALKKAGIEKPVFGDVIQITGELYRVTGFSNRDYVNHSGDFLTHSVIAAKIRPSSIHDPGLTLKPLEDYIPEDTVLGSRRDYLYYWDQQINFFLKVFPKVAVYQRPEEVVVDLLYQEVVKENKLEWIRHDYPANLTLNPQAADLKKFGIELWRDCKLVVSIPLLKQYGYPLPTVDSIFATEKEFYKITDVFPTNYVTSAWIPLNVVLLGVKYRPSNLEPDEIPTIEQSRTLFFPEHDVQYASSAFAEFNERSFTYVQFIDRNRDSQDFDLLYLEDLEDWKTKGIRYQIPCYVRLEPNAKFLKKFGIDSERDIHISLSKSLADKYMPFERGETGNRMKYPGVGTVVIVEGEPYTITDSPPQHYFGNVYNEESRALGIILFGKKLRSSSFDEREKVYDADQVPEPEKPPSGDDYL